MPVPLWQIISLYLTPQLYGEPEYLNLWRYIFNYKNYPYIGNVKSSKGFTCRQNKSKSFSPYFPPKASSWKRAANHWSVAFGTFYCAQNVVPKALKSDCVGSDVSLSLSSHVTLDKFHHLSAPQFCHPSSGDNNGIYPIDSFRHKMPAWPLRSNKCLQKWGCDEGGIERRNSLGALFPEGDRVAESVSSLGQHEWDSALLSFFLRKQ